MPENSDLKIVVHKLDSLGVKFDSLEVKLDNNIEKSSERLRELEKQTAVMEANHLVICKDVDAMQEKSNRNDVFVFIGNLAVVTAATIANVLGLRDQP